jgi:Protein of unknown function (DUF992)
MNRATMLAAFALVLAVTPAMAQDSARTRIGTLNCNIAPGAGAVIGGQRQMSCAYLPARRGPREVYQGTIGTLGLDIGATSGGRLTWAIFAPTTLGRGALAGTYTGATAGGTVGAGGSVNVLVGGSNRTVMLQPLSVQGQTGLNLAAGVSVLQLQPAGRAAPR